MDNKSSLEERVQYLENRVTYLEKKMETMRPTVSSPTTQKVAVKPAASLAKQPRVKPDTSVAKPPEVKEIEWDVLIFQKILPRMFIFVFIIGILWGFKAASDYGFLTDKVKVALGFIVSGAMVLFGMQQLKKNLTVLGQVLIGGAIPILMLTTFAMHHLYDLTGPTVAFILNVMWIGLGLYFTYTYKSQGVGIVSSIGGVIVPFLIESTSPNIPVFISYETILYILFIWLALRYRYQVLYYVSAILLNIALFLFVNVVQIPDSYDLLLVSPILVQQIAMLTGFLKTNQMLKLQAYTLFGSVMLSAAWIDFVFNDNLAATVFAFIAALYAACFYFYKNDLVRAPIFIANAVLGILLMAEVLADELIVEVLIGSSLVYMFVANKYKSIFHVLLGGFAYFIALVLVHDNRFQEWFSWEMLHSVIFLAASGYAIYFIGTRKKDHRLIYDLGVPYYALLLLYFTARIAPLFTTNNNIEPIVMSLLWIGISIVFMVLSKSFSIPQGKYVGAGILFLTLAKIIIVDIYFVSVGVKAVLFIMLGIAGLLVSRAYYKK